MQIIQGMLNYLFDNNGVHIIVWYLIMIVIDTILGIVNSAIKSRLKSRTYLKGIYLKLLSISGIIVANCIDDMFKSYMQIDIGIDISDMYAVGLVGYEALSIFENMHAMGIFTGEVPDILSKFFKK